MAQTPWRISIDNFLGGLSPGYYKNTYPSYGNKNQGGRITLCDLMDPTGISSGPNLANLTNGSSSGVVSTLITRIMNKVVSGTTCYAVGGNLLYKLSSTAVINDTGVWPHTIDKAGVTGESGSDVIDYQGNLYYSYNYTSTSAGDIGKYNLDATFDDDWGSTTPTGAAVLVGNVPHKFIIGGSDYLYITNGRYMAQYVGDTNTLSTAKLSLPADQIITSAEWTNSRFYIASNHNPNNTGITNRIVSYISIWDGSSSTLDDIIIVPGQVGGTYCKNGIVYIFYRDHSTYTNYLSYISGTQLVNIASFQGSVPSFSQISEYAGYIIWNTGGIYSDEIYAWGSPDISLPASVFSFMSTGTGANGAGLIGGLSTSFSSLIFVASSDTSGIPTTYRIAKNSGYATTGTGWKSINFDVSQNSNFGRSIIKKIFINTEPLVAGQRLDITLTIDNGTTTWTDNFTYSEAGQFSKPFYPNIEASFFRVELAWTNNSSSKLLVKNIEILGATL